MKLSYHVLAYAALGTVSLSAAEFKFEPLPAQVDVGSLPADAPFALVEGVSQETVFSAESVLNDGDPLTSIPLLGDTTESGAQRTMFDMIAVNLSGEDPGRYLFLAHETRGTGSYMPYGGITRTDLLTGGTSIIAQSADFQAIDPCLWTPFGTIITGEETAGGRLFEIINPLEPDPELAHTIHRTAIPRVAHEGLKFDSKGNLYFVDELSGGSVYKFVPASKDSPLAVGQTFALKVLSGESAGVAVWEPITDETGAALPATEAALFDEDGALALDGRLAADLVGGTNYQRPEDLEIGRLKNRHEVLYVTTTGTHEVYAIELLDSLNANVTLFVSRDTIDLASGEAVSGDLRSPDNLAIDGCGVVYVVEDNSPGDIWAVNDEDGDGIAESIGRFASLSTPGAEPSGLYFNPLNPNEAFVSVQHPSTGDDHIIRLTLPRIVKCHGKEKHEKYEKHEKKEKHQKRGWGHERH